MGMLIRVLPGTFQELPDNLDELVKIRTNFWIFFPVSMAEKRGIIRKVKNCMIPEHSVTPPNFRTGIVDPATKKVASWWLWDGNREWEVGALTDEIRKLPIRGAWNDTLLVERIEEGWLPENDKR
ncbi:hypothetical protein [Pandoraea pulmonicola]|uniref:Uncharacterized protein n=1 Tax=Pandoraea pulmonicola TaxID=93221 RepID=A0AAJ5D090_PANPU|nr:hypothetical protein [Pandoraea pulmonicola]AJC21059.1 hypothetical protein RO07_12385 [Pandoraea pulmonicola]SUA90290.1 Uncharacterised protein [Pandoraea pulmonicola]